MASRARVILVAAAIVCVAGFAFLRWRGEPSAAPHDQAAGAAPAAVPAQTTVAQPATFPIVLQGLGAVQAFNSVTVRSRVDGQIEKILFAEGQMVKQGDPLAVIDPKPFQASLDQANAKKAQDEAQLQNAKADLQRYATLAKKDFATGQQLDTQTATVAQVTALVKADEAAIDNARTQLDYTNIHAPLSGRVGFRLVDQGNIINASSQNSGGSSQNGIVTIQQMQPISVLFTLPENDIEVVRQAMTAGPVKVAAYSTDGARKIAEGVLSVLNNQVDAATGTIQIKATFDNTDNALWPGLAVSAHVAIQQLSNVIVLPQAAIQHGPDGLFVYRVDAGNKVAVQAIEAGPSDNDSMVIAKGVSAGDRVVTSGQYRLSAGATIAPDGASVGRPSANAGGASL